MIRSIHAFFIAVAFFVFAALVFYPRWQKTGTEAIIGWDVSGYYWYLPSIFVYKDLKEQKFAPTILEKYKPTPDFQQAMKLPNGNYVMKYSSGMALQYLPYFLIAHTLAEPLGYAADGFSLPYQLALQIGCLLWSILSMWYLRKILLYYFQDSTVTVTLLGITIGTNYLNYGAIDGAMSHNWLFGWYCFLIYHTHHFYKNPNFRSAFFIGCCLGMMTLTRPTEIIAAVIPLLWGIEGLWQERINLFKTHGQKYALALVVLVLIESIQLCYWKYVSGHWLVYSYGNEGFDWLHIHFARYLWSYRCGWLVYTPLMFFAIAGLFPFIKKKKNTIAILLFLCLYVYIVTAWQTWWYGARAMVQSYPLWAFPMAALIELVNTKNILRYWKYPIYALFILFCYFNLWYTRQLHTGTLYIDFANMTKPYFWKVALRYHVPLESLKLLDTDEEFLGERKNVRLLLASNTSDTLTQERQYSQTHTLSFENDKKPQWLRISCDFRCTEKESQDWLMTQMTVSFEYQGKAIKQRIIKPHRLLQNGEMKLVFMDTQIPKEKIDQVKVYFWNSESKKISIVNQLKIESYDEK